MADILEWRRVSPNDAIIHVVQQLAAGNIVVFPTDTCYVASAYGLQSEAVRKLIELQPISSEQTRLRLAVTGMGQLLDWIPSVSLEVQRLARRSWPGPLTLAFPADETQSIAGELPESVRRQLLKDGRLYVRAPAHEAMLHVLNYSPGPVVFRPLVNAGNKEITSPEELEPLMSKEEITTCIVDGDAHYETNATVAEVDNDGWKITVAGARTEEELQKLTGCHIVFVCTGNTCRSPMAEALCKKLLAEQLNCLPEELPERGYRVQSAGVAAGAGGQASPEAVEIVEDMGADLSQHQSRPLTANMLLGSDYVLTMTASHLQALSGHGMNMISPPTLLSLDGEDVPDPIGGEQEVYRNCAEQILQHLRRRLSEFQQS